MSSVSYGVDAANAGLRSMAGIFGVGLADDKRLFFSLR
jgi:hypothetical protein